MTRTLTTALAGASLFAITMPAMAQDMPNGPATPANTPITQPGGSTPQEGSTDSTALPTQEAAGEIVVTAQRRRERVTDVPISITVASQGQLERQQVNTINDLNRIAPSLEIQQAPGQNTGGGGSIRGIGTQTFSAGAIASVGVVVDQVSQGNANIGDLFDVARVEVLKGPQGTLFGLTTSAGVINITTNAPDPSKIEARVHSELSDAGTAGSKFGDQVVQGVINLPLSDDAAIRVAGLLNRRQGVDRNSYTGNLNDTNRYGFRARLLWKPTSDLSVNLIGDYTDSRADNAGDFFTFTKTSGPGLIFGAVPDFAGITARLAGCGVVAKAGNRDYCSTQNYREHNRNYGGSAQVDYDAGPFTISSITAYRRNTDRGGGAATDVFRADPLALQVENGDVDRRLSLFTQEIRLTSPADQFLEYTIGAFYSHQRELRDPESLSVDLTLPSGFAVPVVRSIGADDSIVDRSMAVFGQGTVHVAPKFRLIAGARFTAEDLSLRRYNLDLAAAGADGNEYEHLNTERVSYRAGAQYDLSRRTMVYATVSRGYKGGQIATPALPLTPFVVKPEIPQAYEVGLKSTLFGGWVLDLNAFYEKIHGFQSQQCTVSATGVISCVNTNINGVKTRGAEINLFGRVFQGLSVNTGFIFAKATYPTNYVGTDGTDIGGTQLAYAPRYKFTFSGEYEHPITDRFKGFVAGDAVWKSRIRYEANSLGESTFHQHWITGGRLGVRTADDRFAIAVFGRNLFNVHEPSLIQTSFPYDGANNVGAIYGPQSFRQVGLSVDAKF